MKNGLHAHVVSLDFAFSLLMFQPSSLLFLHGHFETNLTDALIHIFLPNFPDTEARVKRTLHEDEQFGHLAKTVLLTERHIRPTGTWIRLQRSVLEPFAYGSGQQNFQEVILNSKFGSHAGASPCVCVGVSGLHHEGSRQCTTPTAETKRCTAPSLRL